MPPSNMLRLYKYEGNKFCQYLPSAQTHCQVVEVERWILDAADASGVITNVSIEMHGTSVPLSCAAEAHVVAAMFCADHNDYVTRNLQYPMEEPYFLPDNSDIDTASHSDDEAYFERLKLEENFEQNEELTVGEFGPAKSKEIAW
jgi:hypothetical protein